MRIDSLLPQLAPIAVLPLVIALLEGLKLMGLPLRLVPAAAIGVGILTIALVAAAIPLPLTTVTVASILLQGMAIGLGAIGLYSGVRATAGR